jgi:hypothetical protein
VSTVGNPSQRAASPTFVHLDEMWAVHEPKNVAERIHN